MVYTNSYEVKLQIRTQNYIFLWFIFYFIEEKNIQCIKTKKMNLFQNGMNFVKVKINYAI